MMDIHKYKIVYRKMSPAMKASFALIIVKFFQKGLAFLSSPILTRLMSSSEYGIISTFNSWQSILYIIFTLNLSSGVFNNGMLDYKEDRNKFISSLLILSFVCTIFCSTIYFMFYSLFSRVIQLPISCVIVMILGFLFNPAYQYWQGRQRYEFKYKAMTFVSIATSFISFVISISVVYFVKDGSKAIQKIISTELITIAVGLAFNIILLEKTKFKVKKEYCSYALKFNLPLIPHYLSMYILSSSDRIMINNMVSSSATAIYSIAYTCASIILIVWQAIEASLSPWIYEKLHTEEYYLIKKRVNQVVLLFAVLCILSTLFSPEIMHLLATDEYYEGIYIIPIVSAGVFFTAVYSLYMRIELYFRKRISIMFATLIAAILNLLLNYLMIPRYGYFAAGYTTLLCYILLALFHYYSVKKINCSSMYDNKFIMIVSVVVILICLFVRVIYQYRIIRYCFILLFSMLLIFMIKKKSEFSKKETKL